MDNTRIILPRPTNRTVTGPHFKKDAEGLEIEYDYEHDDGSLELVRVLFSEMLAFEFRDSSCCDADGIVNAHEVRCLSQSDRLSMIVALWQTSVGWQDWQLKQGGAERFKHFTMYFDDAACIHIVAGACQVA
jgi:hypothetical protein